MGTLSDLSVLLHKCPWPECPRKVNARHWGCIEHWNLVPRELQIQWRTHYRPEANVQTQELDWVQAEIQKWAGEYSRKEPATGVAIATGPDSDFAAGITSDERVFMLWPARGEYVALSKTESEVVLKAIRAMLTK